jgi:hypothetical protein
MIEYKGLLSCACSIWAVKLYWLDNFLFYTDNDRNNIFSGTWLDFGKLTANPVHFLRSTDWNNLHQVLSKSTDWKVKWFNNLLEQLSHSFRYIVSNHVFKFAYVLQLWFVFSVMNIQHCFLEFFILILNLINHIYYWIKRYAWDFWEIYFKQKYLN